MPAPEAPEAADAPAEKRDTLVKRFASAPGWKGTGGSRPGAGPAPATTEEATEKRDIPVKRSGPGCEGKGRPGFGGGPPAEGGPPAGAPEEPAKRETEIVKRRHGPHGGHGGEGHPNPNPNPSSEEVDEPAEKRSERKLYLRFARNGVAQ